MKVLIVVSCVLAAASAGFLGPAAYSAGLVHSYGYAGPQHLPVIGPNGVPLDTPEVAAGKVANAVAHAEAHARNGDGLLAPIAAYSGLAHGVVAPLAYAGPQHIPVIGANGVPLDTPEVAAGKVANAVAHAEAKARNGDLAVVAPIAAYSGIAAHGLVSPVALANGLPLDTPEVAHAKAAHAAAHLEAKVRNGVLAPLVHYRKRRGILGAAYASPLAYSGLAHSVYAAPLAYAGPQHIPTIGPNGVPLDTPEVAAGKVANAVAHAEAHARNGDGLIAPIAAYSGLAHGVVAPLAYAGPQHIPVIGPNGVPLDTPEVAAGKVANAVAHAEAKARNGDLAIVAPVAAYSGIAHGVVAPLAYAGPQHLPVIGANGVPLDTPEVAAGKVANAVAHAEAKARNGDLVYHY